jgi:rubrerythrin
MDDKEIKELFAKLADAEAHHLYLAQRVRSKFEQTGAIDQTDYEDLGQG